MKNPSEKRIKKEKKKRDNQHVNKPVPSLKSFNNDRPNLHYVDNDPVRFIFYSTKKEVNLGEEVELSITAQYITLHPGLLTVFPGSNAFSLKIIVPEGFIQTGGDYIDLIGTELSSYQKTVTYTLRGKFISVPDDNSFRLLRSHKNADAVSKFVEKGKLQVICRNSVEPYALGGSSKELRLAASEVACTPFSEVCSGNSQEVRNQTITVTQSGNYSMVVSYRSPEKTVTGIVRIDGVAQNVTFPQISTFQNQTVGTLALSAGTHTIGLSSGSAGGYICFNTICLTNTAPTTPNCDYTITASSSNANPGCGAAITLNAGCSGNDCGGVSYNWSTGQNGQSVNTTAASSNGTTTYTVTAAKTGCSTKTGQATVTVSGCGQTSTSCTPFSEVCSGNSQEIRNQTITVAQSGNYSIAVSYRSPEKAVNGIIRVDGVAQNVTFPQIGTFQNQTVGTLPLSAGTHTIGLSSGTAGGYTCFNNICLTSTTTTSPSCDYTITASSSNANPGCGAAITLNAGCSGNDCGGVSYSWSTGQNGQSVNTTAATSNGTTTYTVTATKTGCAIKTAQAIVTVSGCGAGTLNGCYVIRSKKSGQLLQTLSGDVVEQRTANNLSNQIWKAESAGVNQYRFTIQDGSNKSMQVSSANQGELIRTGTYTGSDLQKWVLLSDNNGGFRLSSANGLLTWDLRNFANDPQLQLWGSPNESVEDYRIFKFESTGCSVSPPTTGSCTTLRNSDSPTNLTNGLTYRYFQTIANNDWCTATGLNSQPVVSSGSVSGFNLTPKLRDENFGLEFTGYIQVPTDGQYTFFLSSDDESRLFIGGQQVVVHSGCHDTAPAGQEPSGSICLRAGYHSIQVLYSQGVGGSALKTFWQGPSITKQEIPISVLFRGGTPTASCDFVVSAIGPATAACNSAIALNAPCTGNDCNGVNYNWSTGQNSQSVNTTSANANGTTTYTVTASRTGCSNKTAQVSVTINGCPSASAYQSMGRAGTRREHFDIVKNILGGIAYISDLKTAPGQGQSGYNTLYFINDVYVGLSLNNYELPVNGKYTVEKIVTKSFPTIGYKRIIDFPNQLNDPSWIIGFHQQVIDTYDSNTSNSSDQVIDSGKGILIPLNELWFIRTNNWNSQAVKDASQRGTPLGKYYGGILQDGKPSSLDEYKIKGWNIFSQTPYAVPTNEQQALPSGGDFIAALGTNTNDFPTYQQGRQAADNMGSKFAKVQGDQMQESGVDMKSDGYIGYYERLKEINPEAFLFGSYGQLGARYLADMDFKTPNGGARNPLDYNSFARLYNSQSEARNSNWNGESIFVDPFYTPRGSSGKSFSNIGMEQLLILYPTHFNEIDMPFVKLHEMNVLLKQDPSRRPIGFYWAWREAPGLNSVSPYYSWDHETTNPAGRVIRQQHSVGSLIASELFAFDMMVRGSGLIFWNNSTLQIDDPNVLEPQYGNFPANEWIPNTAGTPAPVYQSNSVKKAPNAPLVGYDAAHQGKDKAVRALDWLGTSTPTWEYATYSLDGALRQAPANGYAVLQHAADYKPVAMILKNSVNGKRVVWCIDPYCQPNKTQIITVQMDNGQNITIPMKGNALHVVLIN